MSYFNPQSSKTPSPTPALRSYGKGKCEFCGVDFDRQNANSKGNTCSRAGCQQKRRDQTRKENRARLRTAKKASK